MNREEKGSTIPITSPPSSAPGKEPKPPITAAANAFIPIKPTDGSTAPLEAYKMPADPAPDQPCESCVPILGQICDSRTTSNQI